MRRHAGHDTPLAALAVALSLCTPALAQAQTGGCERVAVDDCMGFSIESCADATPDNPCHKSFYLAYSCSIPVRWRITLDHGNVITYFMGDGYTNNEITLRLDNPWDFGERPVVRGMECCDGEAFDNCDSDPDLWDGNP